ncbi:MAG TPA: 16S rRNA (adenine(1518)-N(6)/adenine(1519)-N(6))-dimethyltransferase RsmA [Polyangiaceae bacterium]
MATSPLRPKEHLSALGLRPKHHFGQNFLADAGLAQRIAELCTPRQDGAVVEIGAGLGALTAPLLTRARKLVAIERDRDLVPALRERFADEIAAGQLVIEEADAKTLDWFAHFDAAEPVQLAGNLPYQITGPLLERLCALAPRLAHAVVLVQLEVAARLVAKAGAEDYGALGVFVQAQFKATREIVVRRGAFYPQPNVDSAVVSLVPRQPPVAHETPEFRELVQRAFQQRRKQLRNAWRGACGASEEQLLAAARTAGIDLSQRGEILEVGQFWQMAQELARP